MPTGGNASGMPHSRRALLAGLAAVAGGLAGCSDSSGDDPPRVPRPGGQSTSDDVPDQSITPFHHVFTPVLDEWEEREDEDGNLVLVVDVRNVDPDAVTGNVKATFQTMDGETRSYTESFTLGPEDPGTVEMTLPVSYEEYSTNMSLPQFTFENVTEG